MYTANTAGQMDAPVYMGSTNPWEMACHLAFLLCTVFLYGCNKNHETRQTIIAIHPSA
jgi:hypothetical protein